MYYKRKEKVMKKIFSIVAILAIAVVVSAIDVQADYAGFAGSAGFSPTMVSTQNTKNNYQYLSGVRWDRSSHSNHKMWFRVRNSNGEERGSILVNRPDQVTYFFDTDCKYGYYYWLYANREHLINPSTYVEGVWQP